MRKKENGYKNESVSARPEDQVKSHGNAAH